MTSTATEEPKTNALHGPNLILDVENFGPIAEAKNIEFKPMTVFVGPSNTGKSYLAVLLHAFLQAANPDDDPIGYSQRSQFLGYNGSLAFYTSFKRDVAQWAINQETSNIDNLHISAHVPIEQLSNETHDFIANAISSTVSAIEERSNREIIDYFDLKHEAVNGSYRATYNTTTNISLTCEPFKLSLTDPKSTQSMKRLRGSIPILLRYLDMWSNQQDEGEIEFDRREVSYINRVLVRYIDSQFRIIPRSFYMPTGRTGIMNAHRVLTSQIVRHAHRFGIEDQDNINYHRLARDFLTLLIDLGEHQGATDDRLHSRFASVADLIAHSLIRGEINVTAPEVGLPDFEYVREGVVTPMFRASSMVTELAPVLLVLRHYVHPGNVVIIDEPEAHLHPAAQQQMAAALAFMVRSGLRVLITTHSHYMVEQLSNFVATSTLEQDLRKRVLKLDGALGEKDIYLDEAEVAVYDFATEQSKHGSVVTPVEFNGRNYGYFPKDHNWAIADQMNRTQRVIQASIENRKNASP